MFGDDPQQNAENTRLPHLHDPSSSCRYEVRIEALGQLSLAGVKSLVANATHEGSSISQRLKAFDPSEKLWIK
jgi:hypothetical protein